MILRAYQTKGVNATMADWQRVQRTMLVLATGLGKTVVAAHIVHQRQSLGRCMFLVHRRELMEQAADKIYKVTGERPAIEMGDRWANEHGYFGAKSQFVVSSIQTQIAGMGGKGRMTRFKPDEFSTIVVDECHHATSDSFRRVIDYYLQNPNSKLLGLTATPDRADGTAMAKVFESCAFKMDIREGIDDGYLVPIRIAMPIIHDMDFSQCRTTAGDLNQGDLARVLEDEKVLHHMAKYVVDNVPDKKVLAFAASQVEAEKLTEVFNRYEPDSARFVIDSTPEHTRKEIIQRYRWGEFKRLVNVGVFTEGFDVPGVEVVIPKPTKSRSLYCQMLGRSTRPIENTVDSWSTPEERRMAIASSAKPFALVLDFVGVSGKHKLMTALDVLAGNMDDTVRQRVQRKASDGTAVDLDAEALAAKADIEAERKAHQARMREYIKASRMRATVEYIDAFDAFDLRPPRKDCRRWQQDPTQGQLAFLQRHGIDAGDMGRGDCGRLIQAIRERWNKGLCSHKDAAILKKAGQSGAVSRDEAKRLIAEMAGEAAPSPATRAPRQASDPSAPCNRAQAEVLARFGYPTDVTHGQAAEAIREINQRLRKGELTYV